MAAKATVALGKELGDLKDNYDKLQKHLFSVEKTYHNLILTEKHQDGEIPISIRLQLMAAQLFRSDMFSDVTILLQGGIQVHAHKFVLAASGNNWGVHEFDKVDMLDLTDIRYEVCYAMIKWVYTDEFDFHHKINDDFLIELMQAASICKLESLFIRCQKGLSSILNYENCEKFLKVSEDLESTILKGNCMKILQEKQVRSLLQQTSLEDDSYLEIPELVISSELDNNSYINKSTNIAEDAAKIYKCDVCSKTFTHKSSLTSHKKTHLRDPRKKLTCRTCKRLFISNISLYHHMLTCSERIKSLSGNETLNGKYNVKKKPDHICNICGKKYSYRSELRLHISSHTGVKENICSECGVGFSTKCRLRNHMRKHTGEKPYKCDICNKTFSQRSNLKVHIDYHNGFGRSGRIKDSECSICGLIFYRNRIESHMRTHTREKPYKCDVCDKAFSEVYLMKRHKRKMHDSSKVSSEKVECEKCCFRFSASVLKEHMKRHESPSKCVSCGTEYITPGGIRNHLKAYPDPTHCRCEKCFQMFKSQSSRDKHFCDSKIYQCKVCYKTIPKPRQNLQEHFRKVHDMSLPDAKKKARGSRPIDILKATSTSECHSCGMVFTSAKVLRMHLQSFPDPTHNQCGKCSEILKTGSLKGKHVCRSFLYVCYICKKLVKGSTESMELHLRGVHNVAIYQAKSKSKNVQPIEVFPVQSTLVSILPSDASNDVKLATNSPNKYPHLGANVNQEKPLHNSSDSNKITVPAKNTVKDHSYSSQNLVENLLTVKNESNKMDPNKNIYLIDSYIHPVKYKPI